MGEKRARNGGMNSAAGILFWGFHHDILIIQSALLHTGMEVISILIINGIKLKETLLEKTKSLGIALN